MSRVERDAEDLRDVRIPGGLQGVDFLGDEGKREEGVGIEVVQLAPGGAVGVGEEGVGAGGVEGEGLPGGDVGCGEGEVGGCVDGGRGDESGDGGHGADADYAF